MTTLALRCVAAALLFGTCLTGTFAAETDFAAVKITSIPVAGHIYMLQGNGGNIAVSIGEDGVLIVDDQFAPLSDKIKAAIARLGGGLPKFVINTHHHSDHTGGNENFAKGATLIAQDNVRIHLDDPDAPRAKEALPLITYENSLTLHFNGEDIRLIHLPHGHTDGDSAVWFTGSNVIHMGDEYVVATFPFIDLNSGGSAEGLIENTTDLLPQLPDNIKIIPGHGSLSTKADMAKWVAGVTTTAKIVTDQITAGKKLSAILEKGLPAEYADWGKGFISTEDYLTSVYKSSITP